MTGIAAAHFLHHRFAHASFLRSQCFPVQRFLAFLLACRLRFCFVHFRFQSFQCLKSLLSLSLSGLLLSGLLVSDRLIAGRLLQSLHLQRSLFACFSFLLLSISGLLRGPELGLNSSENFRRFDLFTEQVINHHEFRFCRGAYGSRMGQSIIRLVIVERSQLFSVFSQELGGELPRVDLGSCANKLQKAGLVFPWEFLDCPPCRCNLWAVFNGQHSLFGQFGTDTAFRVMGLLVLALCLFAKPGLFRGLRCGLPQCMDKWFFATLGKRLCATICDFLRRSW